jgi:hypothetical protein
MDVWYVCVCCLVFRQRPCDELIIRPRSCTVCKMIMKLKNQRPGPKGGCQVNKKKGWSPGEVSILPTSP